MKKLNKIRLINWHYFSNVTIDVKNNTLLTGQNAAGKSTILDAIQFVLTAGGQGFNLAAHDHGNRSLKGYVCCKLGLDNQEYLREGDVSSHIALQFYDDVDKNTTTVGVVIDYVASTDTLKAPLFYSYNNEFSDEMFLDDEKYVKNITGFKKTGIVTEIYSTRREAKIEFRRIFGNVNERFFTLIAKALAFKPINNVKDFIYQYLLEEKKIDVESIQDSIRMYKELEMTLKLIKRKIGDLSVINDKYQTVNRHQDRTTILELLTKLTGISDSKSKIEKLEEGIKKAELDLEKLTQDKYRLSETKSMYEERMRVLYSQLSSKDAFKNKEQIDNQIKRIKTDLDASTAKQSKYQALVNNNNILLDNFSKINDSKLYRSLRNLDLMNIDQDNYNDIKNKLVSIKSDLDSRANDIYSEDASLKQEKYNKSKEYSSVVNTIKSLEGRKLRYNPNVVTLMNAINEKLERLGIDSRVSVLAELIEIEDKAWQDAIENFLNNQRFTLIIEPKYYDCALDVFDEIKSKMPVYGVGLVNTKKMTGFDECAPNSLASIITSGNIYAKRYINMVCGNVIMCDNVHELEKYRTSITKDSMVYSSYTVRQLNPKIEKPFIGKNAVQEQLKLFQAEERRIHKEYVDIELKIRGLQQELDVIAKLDIKNIIDQMGINITVDTQKSMIKDLEVKTQNVSKSDESFDEIRVDYELMELKISEQDKKLEELLQLIGRVQNRIEENQKSINQLNEQIIVAQEEFAKVKNNNLALENEVYEIYNNDSKKYNSVSELLYKYNHEMANNSKTIQNSIDELKQKQLEYNNEYNFPGIIGIENIDIYLNEYDKLYKSNLIEYEDKVRQAREDTEKLFKEDFIAKLRNNILEAQDGVRKINQALANVRFGYDQYEFIFPKSKEYSAIYDMVLADDELINGPIMTPEFEEKYEAELATLFDNLAVDEINSEGVISKFTDYRTYMDYDIKITNQNGDITLFSKVFKEKSGGETQVPFYVSIIASFVQLYSQSKSSIGIMMFDEAFDKMDSNRIKKMMSFINELNLQIFIAATPEKLETISKFVDTTLVVHRTEKNVSYVYSKINKESIEA